MPAKRSVSTPEPVKPPRYDRTAPPDADAEKRYTELLKDAEGYGLIVQAYGGVATIAIPSEQRKHKGLRENVLQMAQLNETDVRNGV